MDIELPEPPPVHIHSADLQGLAAVQATGTDGQLYCVIDSEVILNNPAARDYAQAVYSRAVELGSRRMAPAH